MIKKILIGFAILLLLAGVGMLMLNRGMGDIRDMPIGELYLEKVPDGVYHGDFSLGRWSSAVEVTVADNRITAIEVVGGEQQDALKGAAQKVVQAQSLQIDAYSGASITTKALLKSVETAITQAK